MGPTDIVLTEDESAWIAKVAGRLRLIQADAAASPAAERREYLREELARHVKSLLPANRQRILQALLNRFPVGGQVPLAAAADPAPATPAEPVAESPEQQLERLVAAAQMLSPEQGAELARRLQEVGVLPDVGAVSTRDLPAPVRQSLGLAAGQTLYWEQLIHLTAWLVEMFHQMDQQAMATMRELSPRSLLLNRTQDFRTAAARYLLRENQAFETQARAMRSLFGALFLAILGGGREFGRQFVDQLCPAAIEEVVAVESNKGALGGLLGIGPSKKEKCWDKYRDLADAYDSVDKVDRQWKDCLAAFVEKKVFGGRG